MDTPRQYWKTDKGVTHIMTNDLKATICGINLVACPGKHIPAVGHNCQECSAALGEGRPRPVQPVRVMQPMGQIIRQRFNQEQAMVRAAREQKQVARAERQERWRRCYERYRMSDKWQYEKRTPVFERENWLCEACRRAIATQIHHIHYDHVTDEPLWELKAICDECHERLTELDRRRREAREAGQEYWPFSEYEDDDDDLPL